MSACTFFGHQDCPSSIKPKLREVLIDLIENHTVDMFYVGQALRHRDVPEKAPPGRTIRFVPRTVPRNALSDLQQGRGQRSDS